MKKIFILGDRTTWINYAEALENSGAEVIFSDDPKDSISCDALVLTGGSDINPKLFGEANNGSEGIDDERDQKEYELIKLFEGKPILGICRGHQILNAYYGGSLIQHIDAYKRHVRTPENIDNVHTVKASEGSFLRKLYGEEFPVNSSHHQAVKAPGEGFDILAYSDDGYIEATECKEKNIVTVQWHPERMSFKNRRSDTVDGKYIFEFFLSGTN